MNRRDFLKGLGALLGASVVPIKIAQPIAEPVVKRIDIRALLIQNSIKDIQAEEDGKFIRLVQSITHGKQTH